MLLRDKKLKVGFYFCIKFYVVVKNFIIKICKGIKGLYEKESDG